MWGYLSLGRWDPAPAIDFVPECGTLAHISGLLIGLGAPESPESFVSVATAAGVKLHFALDGWVLDFAWSAFLPWFAVGCAWMESFSPQVWFPPPDSTLCVQEGFGGWERILQPYKAGGRRKRKGFLLIR